MPPYKLTNTLYSHHPDDHKTALEIENSEKYLLLIGPGIAKSASYPSPFLQSLLENMVSWCIREKIINQYLSLEDFRKQHSKRSLLRDTLIQLVYLLEEYLSEKQQQQDCLKAVLLDEYTQSGEGEIYRLLARQPFRGFITTTYDTFIETAYAKERQISLPKFYISSIDGAIEAYRNGQPFILKLYGDIDAAASIVLGPRFTKGISGIREQEQLRLLLSMSPALFVGFEETDPDLEALRIIARISAHDIIHGPIKDYYTSTLLPETLPPLSAAIRNIPRATTSPITTQKTQLLPITPKNVSAIEVFTIYVSTDESVRQEINDILIILQKQGWRLICNWGRATIEEEWNKRGYLETANLLLLLVSKDFLKTDFCYSEQIRRAVERHEQEADRCVIPIIARPASLWKGTPFGHLLPLPENGRPVIKQDVLDEYALDEISLSIEKKLEELEPYVGL